jgi:DNA invertase Pin-like site-specific DNA recombinase
MSRALAYLRTSTDTQDLKNQKLEIYDYAGSRNIKIDEFIEMSVSSRKSKKQRRIEELLEKLQEGDTLIVSELSRLGRSTSEVIDLVNELIKKKIHFISTKQNIDIKKQDMNSKIIITMFSLFADLERDLISVRTKEALKSKKAQGIKLGKPKGTIQKSKFDKDTEKIKELLDLGLSVRKIAGILGLKNHIGLNTYINKRNIRS